MPQSSRKRYVLVEKTAKQHGLCYYCLRPTSPEHPQTHPLFRTLDHVVPRRWGGGIHPDNMVLSCMECNREHRDMLMTKCKTMMAHWGDRLTRWLAFDPQI